MYDNARQCYLLKKLWFTVYTHVKSKNLGHIFGRKQGSTYTWGKPGNNFCCLWPTIDVKYNKT